jgi:hypothetical protein
MLKYIILLVLFLASCGDSRNTYDLSDTEFRTYCINYVKEQKADLAVSSVYKLYTTETKKLVIDSFPRHVPILLAAKRHDACYSAYFGECGENNTGDFSIQINSKEWLVDFEYLKFSYILSE